MGHNLINIKIAELLFIAFYYIKIMKLGMLNFSKDCLVMCVEIVRLCLRINLICTCITIGSSEIQIVLTFIRSTQWA